METVTLKSRVGNFTATYRPMEYDNRFGCEVPKKYVFEWNLDKNDCRVSVPSVWWESVKDEYLDRKQDIKYREAFFAI